MKKKWEYNSLVVSGYEMQGHLDNAGQQGWEAYHVLDLGTVIVQGITYPKFSVFFKREVNVIL